MPRARSKSNRFLPEYVTAFKSRHGTPIYRFRRKGYPAGYFKSELGTEEFRAEYHAFLNPAGGKPEPKWRAKPGTLDDLLDRYIAVPDRLGPSSVTQQKVLAVLEDFREGRGERPISLITFEAIDKIIAKKRVKSGTGNKTKGGIHSARKLRKELIRLFDFAVKLRMMPENPARLTDRVKIPVAERSDGFHAWSEVEIAQFRDRWHLGTRQRLAMELLLWTDQRRSDVVRMGRAQIRDGRLPVAQEKTGKTLWIAVAPQLLEAIVAMSPGDTSPFCFLITSRGGPFTKESFGNFFRKACSEAGLPHCSAHGLRKATLRRAAELEITNKGMKALSGQSRDDTLEIYTRSANQVKLADQAIAKLARWEKQMLADRAGEPQEVAINDVP